MKKRIVNSLFYLFYLTFIFLCFQTAKIELVRDGSEIVHAKITREHLWGIIRFHHIVDNVNGAEINIVKSIFPQKRTTSVVSIYSETDVVPVFLGSSYVIGSQVKEIIVTQVNLFIHDRSSIDFSGRYTDGGVYPWIIFIFIALHLWNDLGLNDWYIRVRKKNMAKSICDQKDAPDQKTAR